MSHGRPASSHQLRGVRVLGCFTSWSCPCADLQCSWGPRSSVQWAYLITMLIFSTSPKRSSRLSLITYSPTPPTRSDPTGPIKVITFSAITKCNWIIQQKCRGNAILWGRLGHKDRILETAMVWNVYVFLLFDHWNKTMVPGKFDRDIPRVWATRGIYDKPCQVLIWICFPSIVLPHFSISFTQDSPKFKSHILTLWSCKLYFQPLFLTLSGRSKI